jgi:uncharacterized protein
VSSILAGARPSRRSRRPGASAVTDTAREEELRAILTGNNWFVSVLRLVRERVLPDWVVGAGVIRNLVWDHVHGHKTATPVRDVDVAFFDPADPSRERDAQIERELSELMPSVPWEVTNQAGVHLWYEQKFGYPIEPLRSIEDAVARWPDTATSVAVRLREDDTLQVVAPVGLDDLLGMVVRRNPRQVTRDYCARRVREKRIPQRWPKVMIIDD